MLKRRELVETLAPYRSERARVPSVGGHWAGKTEERAEGMQRMPGGKSRWSQGKDLSWEPLRPELVVEVAYDHMQGTRFRHTAQFRQVAHRQEAARLHLRPARSGAPAGARGDLRLARVTTVSFGPATRMCARHSRVGSSSGSGVSCAGRCASGT
jgi:hypothetical protein